MFQKTAISCLAALLSLTAPPALADGSRQEASAEAAETVLFIGNSFTYAGHSAAWKYRGGSVEDLNEDGVGGVPALFELLTEQAGLDYAVSLETAGGKTLKWHWQNKQELLDQPWDHVVMQDLSVLNRSAPGDPANLIEYAGRLAAMFAESNPDVEISLTSTWSRPDQTYLEDGAWHGEPITEMALDLRRAYDRALAASTHIDGINPVGEAFNCAIAAGVADPNPYDGRAAGKVDLWAYDHYHGSVHGYYLEALVIFARLTGLDPRMFGGEERAANELGIGSKQAAALQTVAWAAVNDEPCADLFAGEDGEPHPEA